MPFLKGKSHVTTLSRADIALVTATSAFKSFYFLFVKEVIDESAFVSEDGPNGRFKIVADRVSLGLWASKWIESGEVNPFTLWTVRTIGDAPSAWKFSLLERFKIRLDDDSLPQTKKRQRGAFVTRRNGKLDVAEAVPIRLRVPHD